MSSGRLRRTVASSACLLLLAFAVAGCAALGAALRTGDALGDAGYQNVSVNVANGTGLPADGLISVSYKSGPAGDDQEDALRAEKIVWDNFPGRLGAVEIIKASGGCTGPVCVNRSNEIASATYAQLAAKFGPRPDGLDKASGAGFIRLPGWVVPFGIGVTVVVIAGIVIAVTLIVKRKRSRPPGPPNWNNRPPDPPTWQSGPQGPPTWQQGPQGPPGPPTWQPGPPGGWPGGSPN